MTAVLRAVKVSPTGNLLKIETTDDATGYAGVTSINPGATIAINGGSPITLTNAVWAQYIDWAWYPLSRQITGILNDGDAGTTFNGSGWSSTGVVDGGQAVALGDAYHTTAVGSDTATYVFNGFYPGPYRVSITLAQIYGAGRTSLARYQIYDGDPGGSPLATVTLDQSQPPSFDTVDVQAHWTDIAGGLAATGAVTLTGGRMSIVISNAAGSGVLVLDAIRAEYQAPPTVPPGSSVVFSAPANTINTTSGAIAAVTNYPVTLSTDATWMPFDAAASHTMKVGYNKNRSGSGETSIWHANRARERDGWVPSGSGSAITVDAHGELTSLTGTATSQLTGYVFTGDDYWQSPTWILPVTMSIRFAYSGGGTPDVSLQDGGAGFTYSSPVVSFNSGLNKWVLTQTVGPQPYTIGRARLLSHTVILRTTALITQVEMYEDSLPAGWNRMVHPIVYNRYQGYGLETIRFLDSYQSNNSSIVDYSDFTDPANISVQLYNTSEIIPVSSVSPVDTSAADSDTALRWFDNVKYNGVVKVTTSAPHNFKLGQFASIDSTPDSFPSSISGFNVNLGGYRLVVPLTSTTLLMMVSTSDNGGQYPGTVPITLASTQTPTVSLGHYSGNGVPFADCVTLCREVGVGGWFNVPQSANDACCTAMANAILAGTPAGMKHRIEYSNEPWNFFFVNSNFMHMLYVHNVWQRAQGQTTLDPASDSQAYAMRACQVHKIFQDIFNAAGRGSDIVRVMNGQTGSAGTTGDYAAYCHRQNLNFDELTIHTYQGMSSGLSDWVIDATAALDRLDVNGLIDLLAACSLDFSWSDGFGKHRTALDSGHGTYFANVKLTSYEGSWDQMAHNGSVGSQLRRAHAVLRHPRMALLEQALLQNFEACGCTLQVKYSADLSSATQGTTGWIDFPRVDEVAGKGDGSDGLYTNANPYDFTKIVSTTAWGRRNWSQLVTGAGGGGGGGGDGGGGSYAGYAAMLANALLAAQLSGGGGVTLMAFHRPLNGVSVSVAQARSAGAATLTVSNGAGFGSVFPLIVTASRAGVALCILEATSRTGNDLTITGAIEGTTDTALQVGDLLEMRPTALAITELQDAITLRGMPTGGSAGQALTKTTSSDYAVAWTTVAAGSSTTPNILCQGRLTLSSGIPVTTSGASSSSVYWTPYRGNQVALYNGSTWDLVSFSETSLSLASGYTAGKNYDVFAWNNGGTLALETVAWTDDATRATALVLQNGIRCKNGALTRRYLGSFRTSTATTCEDTVVRRFVYNDSQRVLRNLYKQDATSHTIGSTNFAGQYFNNNSANKVDFLLGLDDETAIVTGGGAVNVTAGQYGYLGAGFDQVVTDVNFVVGTGYFGCSNAIVKGYLAGYHYIALVEASGSAGTTVTLDAGTISAQIHM